VLLDALAIETAVVPALCEGTGSIEIVSTEGGTSPYSYTLDGSEIFSTLVEQLAPGVYTIGAEDANGCSGSVILEVEQTFDPVNFLTTLSAPYCDVPGSIAITEFTNGNAPYDVWLNGVLQDDLVFEDLIAGSYLIEVADAGGCTGDANVELEALDVVLVPDLSLTNGICETPGSIEVTGVDGGDAPYSYWLDGTEMPTPIFENLGAGDYAVTVTDASGCIGSTGATLITEYPGVAAFTASPFVGEFPLTVNFNNSSIYFNTFEWDFGTGDFSDLENPQFTYTLPGQYEVTLTGIDPINGCTATATWTVYVLLPNNVFIPNSFTPDNDGINDVFKVISEGIDPEYYDLMIFDRWGEIIFRSSDPTQAWTGNVHGGEYYVPTGVYPYLLKFRFVDSVTDEKVAGHVTVVR
ncbi:MAG: gliding motility-associated C-terminal domain-containing protein, partial [Flavobacteriales bacterium]|nr:gliding motility-associated C-terminal domain-containing protein [Flavobacteriales bacterium]